MAGIAKFELSSGHPEDSYFPGSFMNVQRGTHPGANVDRFGSFREGSNGRGFGSGACIPKRNVGDMPPLSQSLMLESIPLDDQNFSRSGELRRALGVSFGGSSSEDSSFGVVHSWPAQSTANVAMGELKRFRGIVLDGSNKARIRVKRLDECMNKLVASLSSRKQKMHDRPNGSNMLKMGTQSCRNPPDLLTQRVDYKAKSFTSNRTRIPMTEKRVESQVSGLLRQHMVVGKGKDTVKEGSLSPDSVEEMMHILPVGGESWDKKMKRKRSVTNVTPRPIDGDVEVKRAMNGRVHNDSVSPASDAHVFRPGSYNGVCPKTKPASAPFASGPSVRPAPKNEMDMASSPRELSGISKEMLFQKSNNRHVVSPRLVTKGKASRVSRVGFPAAGIGSPDSPHMSGVQEEWDQPLNVNKIPSMGGVNNRKRALSGELLSPPNSPMAQWVGQRPQKNSRIRRNNNTCPTLNDDEALMPSEGFVSSDYTVKTSGDMNALFPLSSTSRLTESVKKFAVENESKDKAICATEAEERGANEIQRSVSPGLLSTNRLLVKDKVGDGVRRQGRSGRGLGPSFPRGRISLSGKKLDSLAAAKPVQIMKLTSDKNGSKSSRPTSKKQSERKGIVRLANKSPDCIVESEDDREDLLAAAQLACNTSYNACSSLFWKKTEPLFSVRVKDKSFLPQQKDALTKDLHQPQLIANKEEKHGADHKLESTKATNIVNQVQDRGLSLRVDLEEETKSTSLLYQRVLSALVIEDEFEDLEQSYCEGNPFLSQSRCSNIQVSLHDGLCEGDYSSMHPDVGVLPDSFESYMNGSLAPEINFITDSSTENEHVSIDERLTCELHSIGLCLETVPDLADGENDISFDETVQLEKQLHLLADKKRSSLEKTLKAVEKEKEFEEWSLQQVSVNRLTELAYKKLMASRGNTVAARLGISKVSRPVALAFVKRTLARCRKFEETGTSSFSEPALRDVMLAEQPSCYNFENINSTGVTGQSIQPETKSQGPYKYDAEVPGLNNDSAERGLLQSHDPVLHQSRDTFANNETIVNRGKKKVVFLDDVGNCTALRSPAPVGNSMVGGGAKGKRSERGKDMSARNSIGKFGIPSITNRHSDQKAKSNPKQKAAQLSTHPVGPSASGFRKLVANGSSRKGEEPTLTGNILDPSNKVKDPVDLTNLSLHELDPIGLGVGNDIGGHEDLNSWLNLDEDILLDHDSVGLEIPMDDLSELSMLL